MNESRDKQSALDVSIHPKSFYAFIMLFSFKLIAIARLGLNKPIFVITSNLTKKEMFYFFAGSSKIACAHSDLPAGGLTHRHTHIHILYLHWGSRATS